MSHYEDTYSVSETSLIAISWELEEAKKEAKKWRKIAREMAKVLMDLSEGHDEHDTANKLVKKHFLKLYQSYE